MNQDPKVSYYHSFQQLDQLQEDLQNGKKAVFISNLRCSLMNDPDNTLKNLSMETYELEEKEIKFANE